MNWIAEHATVLSAVITALATAVVGFFTFKLTTTTSGQLKKLGESIGLARDEFNTTHRPKLRVRNVIITNPVPPPLVPLDFISAGQRIVGHLYIVNVGVTSARIIESHCKVFWTNKGGLPMGPPYETEPPNNFAGSGLLESGVPRSFDFRSDQTMGDDAGNYARLAPEHYIYVMGWVRYTDERKVARRMAFCRLYQTVKGEKHPRFCIVNDPDYEHED
jgi:hypothetical protein